jgi:hypothetical protein
MCGRYYSLFDKQQVAEHFHVRRTADNVGIIAPNYNVAPGDPQPVIRRSRETGERELVMMRWGVVPWSPRRKTSSRLFLPSTPRATGLQIQRCGANHSRSVGVWSLPADCTNGQSRDTPSLPPMSQNHLPKNRQLDSAIYSELRRR